MEPSAPGPGTEDEPPIMYSSLKKKEKKQQRILKLKAVLKDGKYQNVFDLSYVNGAEQWFCNACQRPLWGSIYQHELGKRHSQNIWSANRHLGNHKEDTNKPEEPISLDIEPGQPALPGFEGEVGRVALIQEKLDAHKVGPLIGLEYLLELQEKCNEPVYLCVLCEKKGDPRTVLTHLASYHHISQYLQKHFSTCNLALAPYKTKPFKLSRHTTLHKIAEAIEQKFGRLRPHPIEKDSFEKDRLPYLQMVANGQHFSETTGCTFVELVVPDEMTKINGDEKSCEKTPSNKKKQFKKNKFKKNKFKKNKFKKKNPFSPIMACPSKRTKGNAQANPRSKGGSSGVSSAPTARSGNQNGKRSHGSVSSISSNTQAQRSGTQRKKNNTSQARRTQVGGKQEIRGGRGTSESRFKKRNNNSPPRRNPYSRKQRPSLPKRNRSPSPQARVVTPRQNRSMKRDRSPITKVVTPRQNRVMKRNRSPLTKVITPQQNCNSQTRQQKDLADQRIIEKEGGYKLFPLYEKYRKMSRTLELEENKTLKSFQKNPEKHPHYNDEWMKFWDKRCEELQAQGADVSKHDFKPEWIQFWSKKMIELHDAELRSKKNILRKKLGLPEVRPIKFKFGRPPIIPKEKKLNLPMAAEPDEDNEVIIIDEDNDRKSPNRPHSPLDMDVSSESSSRSRSSSCSRKRSKSKEREMPTKRLLDKRSRSRDKRSRSRERSPSREMSQSKDYGDLEIKREISPSREMSPSEDYQDSRDKRSQSREISRLKDDRASRDKRSRSREMSQSKDYGALEIKREMSPSEGYQDSRDKRSRSRERSPSREMSQSKDYGDSEIKREISSSREMSPSEDYQDSRGKRSRSRERRSQSRERTFDRRKSDKRIEYRESSYERDCRPKDRIRTVADLPWEKEKRYRFSNYEDKPRSQSPTDDNDDDLEVNIVDVLRILAALEVSLGSLGPKVLDLLVQALAMEKKEANSSETLLDNDLNCVLFETVNEKLKGQLLAGLVNTRQERAFKKAIKKTANLVQMAGQRKRQWERLIPKVKPTMVPEVDSVGRAAIAKQIATALIMQGRTDVTKDELAQLINAVVGMAEASKNSSEPTTTASFLQQLACGTMSLNTGKERSPSNMENLSDFDLQTRLQSFNDLPSGEQHNLITYVKTLEANDPERVKRLRNFVSLNPSKPGSLNPIQNQVVIKIEPEEDGEDQKNKASEKKIEENEKPASKVHVYSEHKDYNFEDVVKSVSKTVKDKKIVDESSKRSDINLTDAKSLISNLLSNFTKKNSSSSGVDRLGFGVSSKPSTAASSLAASTTDFAKTLSSINIDNLASIVRNVQKITESNKKTPNVAPSQQIPNPHSTPSNASRPNLGSGRDFSPGREFGLGRPIHSERDFRALTDFVPERNFSQSRDIQRNFGPGRDFGSDRNFGPGTDFARDRAFGPGRDLSPVTDLNPGRNMNLGRDLDSERDFGPTRDQGSERDLGSGRYFGLERSWDSGRHLGPVRDFGVGSDIGPGRELGKDMVSVGSNMLPTLRSMGRPVMQHQENPKPCGGNNFSSKQHIQYPNLMDSGPGDCDRRNKPEENAGSGNFKRW